MVGDSAVGLSTLSQTNTVAVYVPDASGVHDNATVFEGGVRKFLVLYYVYGY